MTLALAILGAVTGVAGVDVERDRVVLLGRPHQRDRQLRRDARPDLRENGRDRDGNQHRTNGGRGQQLGAHRGRAEALLHDAAIRVDADATHVAGLRSRAEWLVALTDLPVALVVQTRAYVAFHVFVTLGTGKTVETTEPLRLPKGSLSPT